MPFLIPLPFLLTYYFFSPLVLLILIFFCGLLLLFALDILLLGFDHFIYKSLSVRTSSILFTRFSLKICCFLLCVETVDAMCERLTAHTHDIFILSTRFLHAGFLSLHKIKILFSYSRKTIYFLYLVKNTLDVNQIIRFVFVCMFHLRQ